MRKLLLLTGDIAAGKSTFSEQLSERYRIPAFQKDAIKEVLADHTGFKNREENSRLSRAAVALMGHIFQRCAEGGGDMILEANFRAQEIQKLHIIAKEKHYDVLTLVLRGDTDILYQRYVHRVKYEDRHPAHLTVNLEEKTDFARCTEFLRRECAAGDVIIDVDASDFTYQTDRILLERIDHFMFRSSRRSTGGKTPDRRGENAYMDQTKRIAVAIDGPSGAGKSTLARVAARELGFIYVDTGAIYRTAAYYVLTQGVDPKDGAAVEKLLPAVNISMDYDGGGLQRMLLNGEDVTDHIRTQEVSMTTSAVSAHPAVRAFLLKMQRDMAERHSVIMDGRDIGTVVLPQASVKIFLTAASEERARRRWEELRQRGTPRDFDQLLRETVERDERDSNRAVAPLRPAEDAVILDTTALSFEESCRRIVEIIRERTGL